jgi:cyclophilin family peptidyl-prolyl cis-trans isomerase
LIYSKEGQEELKIYSKDNMQDITKTIIVVLGIIILGTLVIFLFGNKQTEQLIENSVPEVKTEVNNLENNQELNNMEEQKQIVTLKTNQGDIKLELFIEQTPKTAGNFIKLASENFYDGVRFHRVIKGFMIQGGDPLSKDVANKMVWGTGDPGYKFADEFAPGLSNVRGTISMANSGPNTNGSQFFINTADNVFLDGRHAVFGKVIEGMDVVDKIESTPKGERDIPVSDMIINDVEI